MRLKIGKKLKTTCHNSKFTGSHQKRVNTLCTYYFVVDCSRVARILQGGGRGFFGSSMQPKTNLTQIFISLKLDWGGFFVKIWWSPKKKEKKCLLRNLKGFSGRNQKFKVFSRRMQVISNKKRSSPKFKGFLRPKLKIQRVFLAEIRWSQNKRKKKERSLPTLSELQNQTNPLFWSKQRQVLHNFGSRIFLGGAVFIFGAKIGLKSTKNVLFCIFFRPMGGSSSPHPPAVYATGRLSRTVIC